MKKIMVAVIVLAGIALWNYAYLQQMENKEQKMKKSLKKEAERIMRLSRKLREENDVNKEEKESANSEEKEYVNKEEKKDINKDKEGSDKEEESVNIEEFSLGKSIDYDKISAKVSSNMVAKEFDWNILEELDLKVKDKKIEVEFPEILLALRGKKVVLSGVAILLRLGVSEGKVQKFVMIPPDGLLWCCGPMPMLKQKCIIEVSCGENTFDQPKETPFYAVVEGEFGFKPLIVNEFLFSLSADRIYPFLLRDVVDENALNACEEDPESFLKK